jgi:dTDP-3-amino-3,4,6-trideoxy-alpha-D-glucose transaminase
MVSANDFRRQWQDLRDDALQTLARVGETGRYILGPETEAFENELAAHWGRKYAVGVANGQDAIELSLRALGCQAGDAVLTTPLSAFATTLAILKLGAVPVFIDTDEYGLVDLKRCKDLLWRRPEIRYFVPVHLYGHALDGPQLKSLRKEFSLHIVEDCAQSIGAHFRGEATGTSGQMAAVSFYPTKNLGAMGDGGAILTDRPEWQARIAALRDYGQTAKYRHEFIGYNSRLDELQAAILRQVMLPRLAKWLARRGEIAGQYVAGIRNSAIQVFGAPEGSESNWHLFPLLTQPEHKRAFVDHLRASGIEPGEHYPAILPDQPAMAHAAFELADDCATARRIARSEVSLPIHPYLTEEEVARIVEAVNSFTPED